jgi:diguanylate cyclase (GGDEF)-like protein/PAS domain S-box-containing protein
MLPVSKRLLLLIWPFLAIVMIVLLLAAASMDILSAGRAYTEGESVWSKGQKEAVFFLLQYADTHSDEDYQKYLENIAVPLGDRKARLEMEKPQFSYDVARQGLLEGRTHPDDVAAVIRLFRNFRHVSYIDKVVTIWAEGDTYILELQAVAEELHGKVLDGTLDGEARATLVQKIKGVDARLTPLEDAFSYTLGVATRQTELLLLFLTIAVACLLIPIGILLSRRILQRNEAFEEALKLSERRLHLAVTGTNDGLWDWDVPARRVYFSPRFKELLGYADHELADTPDAFVALLHNEDREVTVAALRESLTRDAPYDAEYRLRTKQGEYRWFRARGQAVRDGTGRAVRMAGSLTDITDRKLAEVQLFAEKEKAQVTLESIGDAVITTDTEGWIEYMNPVAETLTGWTAHEAAGLPLQAILRIVDENTRQVPPNPIEIVLRDERAVEVSANILLVRNDGGEIPIVESAAPIRDRAGRISGVVLVFHDVSRERQYAARLSYQASHDSLTGLINRIEFERRLGLALTTSAELQRHHAVMYLDLDQFKVVNDTCGHAAGDELMRQISVLLQQRMREGDTLARLGGDEFGVLLENCPPEHALRIADEMRETVRDFHFAWNNRTFAVGVSIGLVNLAEGAFTLADVLSAADAACYMAKDKGRNRVQLYHPDDSELSMRHGEMEWVGRIQKALDEDRFCLYSQSIVPVGSKRSHGVHCEVLVRMLDERGAVVPPMAFIPAAERYGLMPALDRWVIHNAFSKLTEMRADTSIEPIVTCSINISGASIVDERFLGYVRDKFAEFNVPHSTICFEITETAAIGNLAKAKQFIDDLRAFGCRFSLDDFGAGMSSFAYLKHLPVDFLKIDGGFVKDMPDDPIDRAMVEAINSVGHVMGKITIAEFVENDACLRILREIGVDFAQGYGIDRPAPFGVAVSTHARPRATSVGHH